MEIREAGRAEIRKLTQAPEAASLGFPSGDSLHKLRRDPRILMPVVVAGPEVVGVAIAEVHTDRGNRVGRIRCLASLVGEGAVDGAIKAALLTWLEQKFRRLHADEIELMGDQPAEFLAELTKAGYRLEAQGPGDPVAGSPPRLVKLLKPAEPAQAGAGPVRARRGVVA